MRILLEITPQHLHDTTQRLIVGSEAQLVRLDREDRLVPFRECPLFCEGLEEEGDVGCNLLRRIGY